MKNTAISFVASVLAFILFFSLTGIFEFVFHALDQIRGDNLFLQNIWSSLFAAIIASYLAMKTIELIFSKYRKIYILTLYSASLLAFLIWSLYVMIPTAKLAGFTIQDFLIQVLDPLAAIFTALFTLKESKIKEKSLENYEISDDDFEEVPYEKVLKDYGITDNADKKRD